MKAVGYYRVSTDRQGRSGLGLAAQKTIVRHYCAVHKIDLEREYVEVKSGRNGTRPVAQKAIRYCRKHNLVLLVATQSRLARSVAFIAGLMESGFVFVCVDNPNATDFQKHVQAAFDEHVSKETSRNTKLSLQSAVKKGIRLGGNSKKMQRTLKRKRLAYLNRIRPIIHKLHKKWGTIRKLTEALNRMRFKKLNGKRGGWHISEVHGILKELKK